MANTKNALLRTMVIDRCLSDGSRLYTTKDIMEECNKALSAQGMAEVSSLNTIREDIDAIRDQWKVDVIMEVSGRNRFYKYAEPNFTIYNSEITPGQRKKFDTALQLLNELKAELFH